MNTRLEMSILAALGGAAFMLSPGLAHAGNVGYTPMCAHLGQGNPTTIITAAGHTPVPIATANAASLAGLTALMVSNCNGQSMSSTLNADITNAVSGGMKLIINDWQPSGSTGAALPGAPAIAMTFSPGTNIDIPAGSPVASGPGGTLTNTSLDNGNYSNHGFTSSSLPVGSTQLLTTGSSSESIAFSYAVGSGRVIYSAMPLDFYFPGGGGAANAYTAGARTYVINLLAATVSATTCASEGYTGTKLAWCKNICEMGYTGATLDIWIHRWINKYRDLPYCAQEGGGEEEPPPQDA